MHYLTLKLLHAKKLRAPPATKAAERACYECLKEVEGTLAQCLAAVKPPQTKGKRPRKTAAPLPRGSSVDSKGPKSAGELLGLAVARGWVLP